MYKKLMGVNICGAVGIVIALAVLQSMTLFVSQGMPFLILPMIYAVSFSLSAIAVIKLRSWARILYIYLMVVWVGLGLSLFLTASMLKVDPFNMIEFLSIFVLPATFSISYLVKPTIRSRFDEAIHWLGKKILVIDDDQGFVAMLKTNLIARGFDVVTALTGERGLVEAEAKKPDLILLDVILPGIKGRDVCIRLKDNPKTKNIPVIFLTAKNSPDDIKAEMAVGGVTHITKPVDFPRLLQEINTILGIL